MGIAVRRSSDHGLGRQGSGDETEGEDQADQCTDGFHGSGVAGKAMGCKLPTLPRQVESRDNETRACDAMIVEADFGYFG